MGELNYRAAVIGCGRIAGTIEDELRPLPGIQPLPYGHAGAYQSANRIDLVAAVDPDAKKLAAFGGRWGVADLYEETIEMLDTVEPHIVSICVPTRLHAELATAVVRHGVRGVLLEKPIGTTLEQADNLIAEAAAAGTVVAINHTRTFDPIHTRAAELIHSGFIGTPHTVFATWGEGWSFGGCHLFDLLRLFLASRPVRIFCENENQDHPDPGGYAYLVYDSGTRVFVSAPREPLCPLELDVIGTEGRLRIGAFTLQLLRNDNSQGAPVPTEWPFPARVEMPSAMTQLVNEVVTAVEGGPAVRSGLREGRQALEIAIALNESARRQVPVDLPITDSTAGIDAL